MSKTLIEKSRIPVSRVFVAVFVFFALFSESKWEEVIPFVSTVLFFCGIALVGVASLGRLWCSLYIAGKKTKFLITEGPYSVSRNPLYFFSFLGAIGVGLSNESFTFALLALFAFLLYYPMVMREESNRLKEVHGADYKEYADSVPYFWPNWRLLKEPDFYEVNTKVFRKHIFSALWFIWIVGFLELIESFHELGVLPIWFKLW